MNLYTKTLLQNVCLFILIAFGLWQTKSAWCLLGLFMMFKVEANKDDEVKERSVLDS